MYNISLFIPIHQLFVLVYYYYYYYIIIITIIIFITITIINPRRACAQRGLL